jgi:hypothetical protein
MVRPLHIDFNKIPVLQRYNKIPADITAGIAQ